MHYVGLVVAYTWNREKQMFVALGKEFDMYQFIIVVIPENGLHAILSLQLLKGD